MFCVECGEKFEDGATICPKCGKPVGGEKRDYVSEGKVVFEKMQSGSFWISIMRIFAWVVLGLFVLAGLSFFISSIGSYFIGTGMGFLVFIGSILFGLLSVASIMIFLDLAKDVSEIKNELKRMNSR